MSARKGDEKLGPFEGQSYALGTLIQLKTFGSNGEEAIEKAIERLGDIDDKMSVFKNYSEVSRINQSAGICEEIVSKDTFFVIQKAIEYAFLSKGAFDPTVRPVVGLWGIQTEYAHIPEKNELGEMVKLINYKDVILDESKHAVKLKYKNQSIDLGAIAKGFAADEVKNIFEEYEIKSALINLGGNIFVMGNKPDGTAWNIGIQNPIKPRGEYVGIITSSDQSIVTSGNYERYFKRDGKIYHHIIDPQNGNPSDNGIISVSILSKDSIDGDALSTCAYVMGLRKSIELIEAIEGTDAIFITNDKKVYTTLGIKEHFILCDDEFLHECL